MIICKYNYILNGVIQIKYYCFNMNSFEENLEKKLTAIGFTNHNFIIDAACGTGEWSNILSKLNNYVFAYDNSNESIKIAKNNFSATKNLNFVVASLLDSPVKKNKADAIICADSLMFANPILVFNSFRNQLKNGGVVYLSVNGFGWILNCIFNRGIKKFEVSKINMGLRIISDTFIRRFINENYKVTNTVYSLFDLKKIASNTGFEVLYVGYEGTYLNQDYKNYQPLFNKTYFGITQSIEVVLRKSE